MLTVEVAKNRCANNVRVAAVGTRWVTVLAAVLSPSLQIRSSLDPLDGGERGGYSANEEVVNAF